MTESVRIFIPGVPVPKARPRFGRGRVFTPKKTRAYEDTIRLEATLAMKGRKPLTGPVKFTLTAWLPIPRSWSRVKRHEADAGFIRHTSKPDLTNICKAAEDGCNGVVFKDDSQIMFAEIRKSYGIHTGLTIIVEPA